MRATLTSRDRIAAAGGGMGREIREMFARVAGRYDCLNHLLSLGRDRAWRRRAVGALAPLPPRARVLDVCAGTLDFALTVRKAQPDARLVGADFWEEARRTGDSPGVRGRAEAAVSEKFV
jgi:demethylmenaquinone methyltransferase/2-methoxy-6-polyprenyl-1,4-benzoquinol methylase